MPGYGSQPPPDRGEHGGRRVSRPPLSSVQPGKDWTDLSEYDSADWDEPAPVQSQRSRLFGISAPTYGPRDEITGATFRPFPVGQQIAMHAAAFSERMRQSAIRSHPSSYEGDEPF